MFASLTRPRKPLLTSGPLIPSTPCRTGVSSVQTEPLGRVGHLDAGGGAFVSCHGLRTRSKATESLPSQMALSSRTHFPNSPTMSVRSDDAETTVERQVSMIQFPIGALILYSLAEELLSQRG